MIKYTKEALQEAATQSTSVAGVVRFFGLAQAGGTATHLRNRLRSLGVDTTHFTGQSWLKGGSSSTRKPAVVLLVLEDRQSRRRDAHQLRRALLEIGRKHACESCEIGSEYNGRLLVLEVDHINGLFYDNRANNLRFLCPNCHSQEPTSKSWSGRYLPYDMPD